MESGLTKTSFSLSSKLLKVLRSLECAVKVPFSWILERVTFSYLGITKNCLVYLDGLLFLPSGPGNEQLRSLGEGPGPLGMNLALPSRWLLCKV